MVKVAVTLEGDTPKILAHATLASFASNPLSPIYKFQFFLISIILSINFCNYN